MKLGSNRHALGKEQLYEEENRMIITAEHRPQGNIGAWSESD